MTVRMKDVRATDGTSHQLYASQCRDGSALKGVGNGEWWGVRNDCNGFFSVHRSREEAEAEAKGYGEGCEVYVVPVLVFVDTDFLRMI